MAAEFVPIPQAYGDLRRITFDAMLTEAILAAEMLQDLTSRDNPASIVRLVEKAQATYRDIQKRRGTLVLSRDEASLLQEKMDRLHAQLRFFTQNPGGYKA